jgi:ribonuclease III family protein
VEEAVKFDQFEFLKQQTFAQITADGSPVERFTDVKPECLHPLVLAYIGDAVFNLYVRTKLLNFEQTRVRVLHGYGAKMVSATLQAYALRQMEQELTEKERDIIRRGRNAKSNVPKSASVGDYRSSTGFEALLGYLFLEGNHVRLSDIAEQCFVIISRKLTNIDES